MTHHPFATQQPPLPAISPHHPLIRQSICWLLCLFRLYMPSGFKMTAIVISEKCFSSIFIDRILPQESFPWPSRNVTVALNKCITRNKGGLLCNTFVGGRNGADMSAILPNCDFEGDVHKKIKKFVVHFYAVESSVWNAHIDSISLVPRFPADRNLWAVPRNLSMVFSPLYRGARGCCSWIVFHRAFKPRSRTVINCMLVCIHELCVEIYAILVQKNVLMF